MLEGLIPELFDEIVALLDLPDLYPLRLASRRLEQRSRAAFSILAFSEITTDLSRASISRLSRIASSRFAPAVLRLHVGDWGGHREKSPWGRDAPYGKEGHWPRLESGAVSPGSALAAEFSAAISRFPNCAAATVTDELVRIVRHPSDVGPERCLSSPDAAELVLRAYSSSAPGAPPLRSFRVLIRRDLDWWLPGSITAATVASARQALAGHLRELVLKSSGPEPDDWLNQTLDLATASPSLVTLRLLFGDLVREGGELVAGYRLGERLEGFAPPLEHLTLGGLAMREADLLCLLSQWSDTLETLAFYHMKLSPGIWTGVLQNLHDKPFNRLRRFSMQRCLDGDDRATTAFCPLWKARKELQESCDGEFEFRFSRTNGRGRRELHIAGVLFEPRRGAPGMGLGLRAMMEYSHRPSVEPGVTPPCAPDQDIRVCGPTSDSYTRWTGLGPEYRSP
ncbi:uncharacterized protein DNG_06780 [Cephalotrichum gorgonifer]|uniref:F-box domain-containing protein n=1 Tax=Cephalotrichum gorgonifer TaxID=2041049 RepID=A0AAE8SXM4_9PEZI|nr:uncharacterized protein DNG_06780 [Cephalotrichum gorgonifer]